MNLKSSEQSVLGTPMSSLAKATRARTCIEYDKFSQSEHFPLALTQPLGHTASRDAELVELPKGPTYLLAHSVLLKIEMQIFSFLFLVQ